MPSTTILAQKLEELERRLKALEEKVNKPKKAPKKKGDKKK